MDRWTRRMAIATGTAALAAMGALTACSPTTEKEAPATSSTSSAAPSSAAPSSAAPSASSPASSSAPAVSPTEKAVGPGGDESFSPTVDPTPPGAVCKEIVNGVCIR